MQLRTAHEMFASMGADESQNEPAPGTAGHGERVRKRTTNLPTQLTARETQIARLADDGLSNPEIAAQLLAGRTSGC